MENPGTLILGFLSGADANRTRVFRGSKSLSTCLSQYCIFVIWLDMGFLPNSYSGSTWAGVTDITHLHLIVMIPLGRNHTENSEGYTPNENPCPALSHLNHLVIRLHKRKHKRSCCQLLFWYPGFTGPLPSPDMLTINNRLNQNQNSPIINIMLFLSFPGYRHVLRHHEN